MKNHKLFIHGLMIAIGLVVLFFVSLIGLITGLANPSIFTRITKKEITKKR